jgi:hypothetical protein
MLVRVEQAARARLEGQLIISGDFAADFYAPLPGRDRD